MTATDRVIILGFIVALLGLLIAVLCFAFTGDQQEIPMIEQNTQFILWLLRVNH